MNQVERSRSGRRGRPERLGLLPDDCRQRLGRARSREGSPARRHLVEDRAEREQVGPEVERVSDRLLGRHVADRSHDDARLGADRHGRRAAVSAPAASGLRQLGEAEVEDLGEPVPRDHHVLGLEVPVHDARRRGPWRGRRRSGRRSRAAASAAARPSASSSRSVRPSTSSIAMYDVAVRFADVVDGDDVGMVERRGGPRFLLEAPQASGSADTLGGQDLDRHLAPEPRVPRPVDLSHPARAEGDRIS